VHILQLKTVNFNKKNLAALIAAFVIVGSVLLFKIYAAGPSASFEAENSSLTGSASVGNDTDASGGKYLQFGSIASCSVRLAPGDNIQSQLDSHAAGTAFCFSAGTYRLTAALQPPTGDSLVADPGAILNGSKVVTGFTASGSNWTANVPVTQIAPNGQCTPGYTACIYNEQVFVDSKPLWRVATLAEVQPGKFYFDYSTNVLYLADNPSGHEVEMAVSNGAIKSKTTTTNNVTVSGFVIEKFANPAQQGAVHCAFASGWIIQNNEIRLNHGAAIRSCNNNKVLNNKVHDQGQIGITGHDSGTLVDGNEVYNNDTAGFWENWDAGGSKWANAHNYTIQNNYFHDNVGNGIWCDVQDDHMLIQNNRSENNGDQGIRYEVSYFGTITGNTVLNNGGIGITDSDSPETTISNNIVSGNKGGGIRPILGSSDRGSGQFGPFDLHNVLVSNNIVDMVPGSVSGLIDLQGTSSFDPAKNNRFTGNQWTVHDSGKYLYWNGAKRTWSEWQAFGQDTNGAYALK